jgi:hypothetical protein
LGKTFRFVCYLIKTHIVQKVVTAEKKKASAITQKRIRNRETKKNKNKKQMRLILHGH